MMAPALAQEEQVRELEPVPPQVRLRQLNQTQLLALQQVLARAPAGAQQAQELAREVDLILRQQRAVRERGQVRLQLQVQRALRLPYGTPITGETPGPVPMTRKRAGPNGAPILK